MGIKDGNTFTSLASVGKGKSAFQSGTHKDDSSQGLTPNKSKTGFNGPKDPRKSAVPKLAMVNNVQQMTNAATLLLESPSVALFSKQPLITDFLFGRGKENQPPQTTLTTEYSSSKHHNTTSMINTSKRRSSEQVKVSGYATDTVQMDVKPEATAWASDDDVTSSRVTVENMPIVKKALIKKKRC